MAHNERALALYRRLGFEVEGTRRDSVLVDGRYVDELTMAKLLVP
jgi:RimJ/RimL family protein N-acetyltransferase